MRNQRRIPVHSAVSRIIVIAIAALIAGTFAGITDVNAETLSDQYVNGVGYVANPGTVGWYSGGLYVVGQSTSDTSLWYIYGSARIWHPEYPPPNLKESETAQEWYNSTGQALPAIFGGNSGDKGVTHSYFAREGYSGNAYFTSYPDRTGSCWNFWNDGSSC